MKTVAWTWEAFAKYREVKARCFGKSKPMARCTCKGNTHIPSKEEFETLENDGVRQVAPHMAQDEGA